MVKQGARFAVDVAGTKTRIAPRYVLAARFAGISAITLCRPNAGVSAWVRVSLV